MSASNISIVTKQSSSAGVSGRTRLMGVYFLNLLGDGSTNTQGTINLRNGADVSAPVLWTIGAPKPAGGMSIDVPDGGILFSAGIFIDIVSLTPTTSVTDVTLMFEGGAAA